MTQPRSITVLVVSHAQEDAEALNRVLRAEAYASNCVWINNAEQFAKAINDDIDLVAVRQHEQAPPLAAIVELTRARDCRQAVLAIAEAADEADIAGAMQLGAADLVTLSEPTRLGHTLKRELRLYELDRRVNHSRNNAATIQQHLSTLIDNVPDAIAHVQEGIIVETNKAWRERFGYESEDDCLALPLMDVVASASQGTVKGALKAIGKDRWTGEPLTVEIKKADGEVQALSLELAAAHFDGEPAVRIAIKSEEKPDKRVTSLMRDAMNKDQSTFLYHRTHFLKLVRERLARPLESGQRLFAWIRIDNFKSVRDELGVIKSEEIIADFAELLRQRIDKQDIPGRFEGTAFTVLLERSSEEDAMVWGRAFVDAVAERMFEAGERTTNLTCTVGIAPHNDLIKSVDELVEQAEATYVEARAVGDSRVLLREHSDEDTRIRNHDAIWARRLTEALKDNRFRLLQQPIAALDGEGGTLFDILVRLLDEQNEPVAPSEFLPAARRTKMMHAIDRWVIGASIGFCNERKPDLLFVRLSDQSLTDKSFTAWLKTMLIKSRVPPAKLCLQITEETALNYLKAAMQLATFVRSLGCRFALEHCGTSDKTEKLLAALPLDFAKIDGTLIANLAADENVRAQTESIVAAASASEIKTIAEKVQDANTMAALWQLGISYMQGHYVQEPEVILQESA